MHTTAHANRIGLNSPSDLTTCKGLKIVQLNCCSLLKKIDGIRQTLIAQSDIHILCITESWFKPHHCSDLLNIPNYSLIRLDRTRTAMNGSFIHGGGVACYIREDVNYQELDLNYSTVDLELLTITILLEDHRKYFLCILYRPPSGNYTVALNKLTDVLTTIREIRNRHSIILGGDFNIGVSKTWITPMLRAFKAFCSEYSLDCVAGTPTRFTITGRPATIDLFLTDSNIVSQHGSINYNISDHLPVYMVLKKRKEAYTSTTFCGRSYTNYDKELFQNRLFFTNWGRFFAMDDVNCAWDFFYNAILSEANVMCPVKTFKIRRNRPPWFNTDLIELSANRDNLYSRGRRLHNNDLLNEARKLKNLIKHDLEQYKREFFLQQLTEFKHDSKKYWRTLNDLLCKENSKYIDKILDPVTLSMAGPEDAAEQLNEFYVTITDKLVNAPPDYSGIVCDSKFKFDQMISERFLKSILKEFTPTKSSGCLQISSKLYLDAFEALPEQLLFLLNLSLRTQFFPTAWKKSVVIQIPKTGDRYLMENT